MKNEILFCIRLLAIILNAPNIIDCPALKRVVVPATVTHIHNDCIYNCGDAVVVTPKDSYTWNWAKGWGIPVQEPD